MVSRVVRLQLRSKLSPGEMGARAGTGTTEADVSLFALDDCDIFKPDGTPLLMLRRNGVSKDAADLAYPALYELRHQLTDNRGAYGGFKRGKEAAIRMREDGRLSRQNRTLNEDGQIVRVASAVVGYYDRQGGRFPFCRATAYTANKVEEWKTVLPMIGEVARAFQRTAPDRCAKQMERVAITPPEYVIPDTPFTTLTVNNNVAPSAIHKDAGDYKDGLGVISMVRRGSYRGGWLVFPEYRVGLDLQNCDLVFFNSHEWHGVTPMVDASEDAARISVVYYFRDKMTECLPFEEELARAKARGDVT